MFVDSGSKSLFPQYEKKKLIGEAQNRGIIGILIYMKLVDLPEFD